MATTTAVIPSVQIPGGATVLGPFAIPAGLNGFVLALDVALATLPFGVTVDYAPDGVTFALVAGSVLAAIGPKSRTDLTPDPTYRLAGDLGTVGVAKVLTTANGKIRVSITNGGPAFVTAGGSLVVS
jgi:hypothetical protein